jgi:high-affinity iron transporter
VVRGAVWLAGSVPAVLTFWVADLSSRAQEAVAGLLSVFAVGLVTWMIFWMRRTAAGLAAHLRGEVRRAALVGAGALTVTAFLAVGREGLETTLFLWTAARASGQTTAPLVGAAIGIAARSRCAGCCTGGRSGWNVGVFLTGPRSRASSLDRCRGARLRARDLQDAGLLPCTPTGSRST